MLARLRVRGMKAHDDTMVDLSPAGVTLVDGESECGKSTVLEALCFLLFGQDSSGRSVTAEVIRDGCSLVDIEGTTRGGTVLRRTMTKTRVVKRYVNGVAVTTEALFADELKGLGEQVTLDGKKHRLARLIMAPLSWLEFSTQNARGLRDLLDVGGGVDDRELIAELMGGTLRKNDVPTAKWAAESRKKATTAKDEAAGRAKAARETLDEYPEVKASESDGEIEGALTVIHRENAWKAYDKAEATRAEAVSAHAQVASRKRSVAAVASRTLDDALKEFNAAKANPPSTTSEKVEEARAVVEDLERRLEVLLESTSEACRSCEHGPANQISDLRSSTNDARANHGELVTACKKKLQAANKRHKAELIRLRDDGIAKEGARSKANDAVGKAEKKLQTAIAESGKLSAWGQSIEALGPKPEAEEPPPPTKKPDKKRPSANAVSNARVLLSNHEKDRGARAQAAKHRGFAKSKLADATKAIEARLADIAHFDKLLAACRQAPSVRLRKNLEKFGDLGPVSIVVPSTGIAAAVVLIDGRPWGMASTGKQIYADAHLRAAIRRAYNMGPVPIFVDRIQDWTGKFDICGPLVAMRTTRGKKFTSTVHNG
jgi:hypothetical protein